MTIEEAKDFVYQAVLFAQNNGEFHEGEYADVDYVAAYFILIRELKSKGKSKLYKKNGRIRYV